jgi:hypothetical protein
MQYLRRYPGYLHKYGNNAIFAQVSRIPAQIRQQCNICAGIPDTCTNIALLPHVQLIAAIRLPAVRLSSPRNATVELSAAESPHSCRLPKAGRARALSDPQAAGPPARIPRTPSSAARTPPPWRWRTACCVARACRVAATAAPELLFILEDKEENGSSPSSWDP